MADNKVEYVITLKDLFSNGIKKAKSETDELNNSVNTTNTSLGGLAKMAVGAFATIGIASFVRSVVEVGSSFESAEMGLKTFLGTSELAHSAYLGIQEDAQKTPFDFQSLLQANRMLISSGESAEQARGNILNLANAIASTGGGSDELSRMSVNLQQIKNVGKATAMDIKQFAFAGINIYGLLADATGKSTAQVKDMEVSYDLLTYALQKAGKEGGIYYGGLENAMNTTQGKISNLGDQFAVFKNQIFKALQPAINYLISGLSNIMTYLGKTVTFFAENRKYISVLTTGIITLTLWWNRWRIAMIANNVVSLVSRAYTFAMTTATYGLRTALYMTGVAGTTMWSALTLGLSLAIPAIQYLWLKFEGFRHTVMGIIQVFKEMASALKHLLSFDVKGSLNITRGLDTAFDRGYRADKLKEKKTLSQKAKETGLGSLEKPFKPNDLKMPTIPSGEVSKVQQKQATQIHINIGKLIESQNIKIENATKDFADKLHTAVSEVLLNVINDANRIATQ